MKKHSKNFSLIKLSEECGELQHIAAKTIIKLNNKNLSLLEDEIADVLAASKIVINRFNLDENKINKRVIEKLDKYDTYKLIIDLETGIVIS